MHSIGKIQVDESAQASDNCSNGLYWEHSYEIVIALMSTYPDIQIDNVGINQLKDLIVALPDFADDPSSGHEHVLRDILREWFEEMSE
jgi:FeS assembly protein IscX